MCIHPPFFSIGTLQRGQGLVVFLMVSLEASSHRACSAAFSSTQYAWIDRDKGSSDLRLYYLLGLTSAFLEVLVSTPLKDERAFRQAPMLTCLTSAGQPLGMPGHCGFGTWRMLRKMAEKIAQFSSIEPSVLRILCGCNK